MTLKELIKTAAGEQLGKPNQPVQSEHKVFWGGNSKLPKSTELNKYKWTNSLYAFPYGEDATPENREAYTKQLQHDFLAQGGDKRFLNDYTWDAVNKRITDAYNKAVEYRGYHPAVKMITHFGSAIPFIGGVFSDINRNAPDMYQQDSEGMLRASLPTSMHPLEYLEQAAYNQGMRGAALQDISHISHDAAVASSYSPYFMPEYVDKKFNGRDTQSARDESDLREEYANSLRDLVDNGQMSADDMVHRTRNLGYLVNAPEANDEWYTRFGKNLTRTAQDFVRDIGFRSSLINLALPAVGRAVGTVGNALGKIPGVASTGRFITAPAVATARAGGSALARITPQAVKSSVPVISNVVKPFAPGIVLQTGRNVLEDAGSHTEGAMNRAMLGLGVNKHYLDMRHNREIYGTDLARQLETGLQNTVVDSEGNIIQINSSNPLDYPKYVQWGNKNGFEGKLDSPEAQSAYINWLTHNPSDDMSFIETPMFTGMSADNRAKALTDKVTTNVIAKAKGSSLIDVVRGKQSKNGVLLDVLLHDKDGSVHDMLHTIIANTDKDTFAEFLKQNAGTGGSGATGSGVSANMTPLYKELYKGIVDRFDTNPNDMPGTVSNMMKLGEAIATAGATRSSEVVQYMRNAVVDSLSNEDVWSRMSDDKAFEMAGILAALHESPGGVESLGDRGAEAEVRIKSIIKERLLDSVWNNPGENLPKVASLFATMYNMPGIAGAVKNPWIFWTGAAALLAGGFFLVSSALDDGDEEDDDEETEYKRALKRNPYA